MLWLQCCKSFLGLHLCACGCNPPFVTWAEIISRSMATGSMSKQHRSNFTSRFDTGQFDICNIEGTSGKKTQMRVQCIKCTNIYIRQLMCSSMETPCCENVKATKTLQDQKDKMRTKQCPFWTTVTRSTALSLQCSGCCSAVYQTKGVCPQEKLHKRRRKSEAWRKTFLPAGKQYCRVNGILLLSGVSVMLLKPLMLCEWDRSVGRKLHFTSYSASTAAASKDLNHVTAPRMVSNSSALLIAPHTKASWTIVELGFGETICSFANFSKDWFALRYKISLVHDFSIILTPTKETPKF